MIGQVLELLLDALHGSVLPDLPGPVLPRDGGAEFEKSLLTRLESTPIPPAEPPAKETAHGSEAEAASRRPAPPVPLASALPQAPLPAAPRSPDATIPLNAAPRSERVETPTPQETPLRTPLKAVPPVPKEAAPHAVVLAEHSPTNHVPRAPARPIPRADVRDAPPVPLRAAPSEPSEPLPKARVAPAPQSAEEPRPTEPVRTAPAQAPRVEVHATGAAARTAVTPVLAPLRPASHTPVATPNVPTRTRETPSPSVLPVRSEPQRIEAQDIEPTPLTPRVHPAEEHVLRAPAQNTPPRNAPIRDALEAVIQFETSAPQPPPVRFETPVAPVATSHATLATNLEALQADIERLAASGGGRARLNLQPPHLGEIDIEVRLRGSQVDVRIVAQQDAARSALHEGRATLTDGLATHSLRIEQLEIVGPLAATPLVSSNTADTPLAPSTPGDAMFGGSQLPDQRRSDPGARASHQAGRSRAGERTAAPARVSNPAGATPATRAGIDLRV